MTPAHVERRTLAPGFTIARALTGLWQMADQERDGRTLDLERAAAAMQPYVDAGLTTFDMADHYGSSELVAGLYRVGSARGTVQCCTKWVPKPGAVTRRGPGGRDARAHAPARRARSTCCSTTPGTTPTRRGSRRCSCCRS
jgi:aryl-alcohol dehydrogenase-like predicted oxidoreductase